MACLTSSSPHPARSSPAAPSRPSGGVARRNLASLDATTGAIGRFNSEVDDTVRVLTRLGNTIFAGGAFDTVDGQARQGLAAFGIDGTLRATAFPPVIGGSVDAFAADGTSNTLLVGGAFQVIGATERPFLAEIDLATGTLTNWNPAPDGRVNAILLDESVAFIGGDFDSVGGQARQNLAAISRSTGLATAWQANASQAVHALGRNGGTLYVAGRFTTLKGEGRGRLGALDTATGNLLPWSPTANDGVVNTLLIGGTTAYVGGSWRQFDGAASPALREVGLVSGVEPAFLQPFTGAINALAASPTRLFAVGNMDHLGDGRGNLAAFDLPQPPPGKPTITAKGKTKRTTKKSKITLKGTSTDATFVEFKIGKAGFKKAKGSPANWKATVRPKPGKTIVKFRASGPGGTSKILKFRILRK